MATRSATQPVAASLLPGSSARCATSVKSTRSTCSPPRGGSPRRSPAAPRAGPASTPAQPTGVEDLHLNAGHRSHRLVRLEEAGDRGHQPPECFPVDLVGPAEVVD